MATPLRLNLSPITGPSTRRLAPTRTPPSVGIPQPTRPAVVARFQHADPLHSIDYHPPVATASIDRATLLMVQHDLEEYCQQRGQQEPACFQLFDWYMNKCQVIEAAVEDGSINQPQGQEARRLNQTLLELASCGGVDQMYRSLQIMKRLEDKKQAAAAAAGTGAAAQSQQPTPQQQQRWQQGSAGGGPKEVHHERLHLAERSTRSASLPPALNPEERAVLTAVFKKADSNSNGRLSWSEFHTALHWIGDDLSDEEVELVSGALDLEGSISLEQFLAIVEQAEEVRASPGADSHFLAHLMHHAPAERNHLPKHI